MKKKSLYICTRFWGNSYLKSRRHINKILKIQSNEQKNISTIEKKKRRNKHGFMDRMALLMEEKFLRVEAKGRHNWLLVNQDKKNNVWMNIFKALLF
jgi:hypothetical protein